MKQWGWPKTIVACAVVVAIAYVGISVVKHRCALGLCRLATKNWLNIPTKGLEASEVGADYTQLAYLLATERLREADRETAEKILLVAGREKLGKLENGDVQKFPCKDLRTMNNLWLGYSGGKFGFTVQRKLYEQIYKDFSGKSGKKSRPVYDIESDAFDHLADNVGWKIPGKSISDGELPINPQAGEGHLPRTYIKLQGCNGVRFSLCLLGFPWYDAAPSISHDFFSRTTSCKL